MSELAGDARGDAVTPSDEPAARWRDLFSGPSGLQMAVSAGGIALHSTTLYITTSILPSVVADMGGMPLYAWNTTVFVVAAIVGAAAAVQVLQRLGVRWAYISAAAAFAAGSALCALAPSMPVMLLGRLIQGLAGGALLAGPYVLVQQALPARLWPRALALFSGMWGVATLLGPAVGGVLAQYANWRLAFGALVVVALALAVGAAAAAWRTKPDTVAQALPMRRLLDETSGCVDMQARRIWTMGIRKQHLAQQLDVSSETLSRGLRALCEAGVIEVRGYDLEVMDTRTLVDIARSGCLPGGQLFAPNAERRLPSRRSQALRSMAKRINA